MSLLRRFMTKRGFATNATMEISPNFVNRNPRNLERMRISYKPDGYHVEKKGRSFWHKLHLEESGKYVTASVEHYENGEVLKVSTMEWPLKQQLYRYNDTSAFVNLARVFAERCLKAGLSEMSCDIVPPKENGKVAKFLETVRENGVVLEEPPQFKAAKPWDQERPEKPWEVQ